MLDTARDHEQLARVHRHLAGAQLHDQRAVGHEEHLILVVVGVSLGRADALRDLEQASVGLAHELLGPELIQRGRGAIDRNRPQCVHATKLARSAGERCNVGVGKDPARGAAGVVDLGSGAQKMRDWKQVAVDADIDIFF
jgi:hypothetical protein